MSPKAGEGRDRRGDSGGGYRPREGSDPRTSSSERRETQDRQKIPRAGKGNKQEGGSTKARQHPGPEDILPYSRPSFPTVHSPRDRDPSSSSSMSSRGSGGRRRGEGGPGARRIPNDMGAFQPGDDDLENISARPH
ncbi:unnamed protein product [Oncorhynchus mykiss]|uniref:Uncharacterized protein n=1 Tax=Oncorhynchus mykiss TaxID=8022 RepID=A0A060XJC7_ONCMY|nr:unnamed protein product [Oncorhynchus mykiss]